MKLDPGTFFTHAQTIKEALDRAEAAHPQFAKSPEGKQLHSAMLDGYNWAMSADTTATLQPLDGGKNPA